MTLGEYAPSGKTVLVCVQNAGGSKHARELTGTALTQGFSSSTIPAVRIGSTIQGGRSASGDR